MKDKFNTDNFEFRIYDSSDAKQENAINILNSDELTNKFFSMWKDILNNINDVYNFYFVYLDNSIVGVITIVNGYKNDIVFSHAILPEFRGNKLSSKIKLEVINYLVNNTDINKMICYVDKNNKNSISSMMRTNPDEIVPVTNDSNKLKVVYDIKKKKEKTKVNHY